MIMRWKRAAGSLVLGGLGLLTLVGCPASTSGGGSVCDQVADITIDATIRCDSDGAMFADPASRATLRAAAVRQCQASLAAPGNGNLSSQYAACIQDLGSTRACRGAGPKPDSCRAPAGTLADGTACAENHQCASQRCKKLGTGTSTAPVSPVTCGTCAPTLPEGAACGTIDADCKEPFACSSATRTCVKRTVVTEGQACDNANECAAGLRCASPSGSTGSAKPVCAKLAAKGETCEGASNCVEGLTCDRTCVDPPAVGQSCKSTSGSSLRCQSGAACVLDTCRTVTVAAPGGACDTVPPAVSEPVRVCLSGECNKATNTCPNFIADGAACTADSKTDRCGLDSTCANGVCMFKDPASCK